jgi:hypothetical protein
MTTLWWLQPGWKEARCISCGAKIWPEGDPDWGYCVECFDARLDEERRLREIDDRREEERLEDERRWYEENREKK